MEEHKVIADDGHVVAATSEGRGEPLVLCHGGTGSPEVFDGLVELVANRLRVIRWSPRGEPHPTARALADLDAVRVHFGLSRMALLGHSAGADVALHYALDYPNRVSSLVYVSGAGVGNAPHVLGRCRELAVPTLIVDGAMGVRPAPDCLDALAAALPDVARVVLPGAGHVPWVESPGSFGWAVLAHVSR